MCSNSYEDNEVLRTKIRVFTVQQNGQNGGDREANCVQIELFTDYKSIYKRFSFIFYIPYMFYF